MIDTNSASSTTTTTSLSYDDRDTMFNKNMNRRDRNLRFSSRVQQQTRKRLLPSNFLYIVAVTLICLLACVTQICLAQESQPIELYGVNYVSRKGKGGGGESFLRRQQTAKAEVLYEKSLKLGMHVTFILTSVFPIIQCCAHYMMTTLIQ